MPTGIVTREAYVTNPTAQIDEGAELEVRGFYTRNFISGDGITPIIGNTTDGQAGPYYSISASINSDGNLEVAAQEIQATTLSNPTATYIEQLWINGTYAQTLIPNTTSIGGWQVPTVYGDSIAYDELATYNRAKRLVYAPATYFTADETIAEILRLAGDQQYATPDTLGIVKISVPALVASSPIAVGDNDPRIPTGFTGTGLTVRQLAPTIKNSIIIQAANGDTAINSIRATDTSPTGYFIYCQNAAQDTPLFLVDVAGGGSFAGNLGVGGSLSAFNAILNQSANGNSAIRSVRATDTLPTGFFAIFQNHAQNTTLFSVDVDGAMGATAATVSGLTTLNNLSVTGGVTLTTPLSVANGGTGTAAWSNAGGVTFYKDSTGKIVGDDTAFTWDYTNHRLVIGTPYSTTVVSSLLPADLVVASSKNSTASGITSAWFGTGTAGSNAALVNFNRARGTQASPTTIVTADTLGMLNFAGYTGSAFISSAQIRVDSTGTIGAARVASQMKFYTSTDATPSVQTLALTLDETQVATFAQQVRGKSFSATGSAGAGFLESLPQSSTALSGLGTGSIRLYSYRPLGTYGRLSWTQSDGFTRQIISDFNASPADGGPLTGNRFYTFPDANATLVQPDAGTANQFLTAISANGVISKGAVADAGASTKGVTKLSVAPASASDPIAVGINDPHMSGEFFLSQYATLALAIAAAANKQLGIDTTTTPSTTQNLSASVLRFLNGGALNPSSGTLTLGAFNSPRAQIFGGAGTLALSGQSNPTLLPEWWGVKMDAVLLTDGAMSSSSNPTRLISATATFTSADIGKAVIVYGAGVGGAALRTTIAGFISTSTVTLTVAASTTVSATRFVYGTDNTTALQKCLTAVPSTGATVSLGNGSMMCGQLAVSSNTRIVGYASTIYQTANALFVSTNASYVTYEGLRIDSGGNRTANGAVSSINATFTSSNRSSNIRVENCAFFDTFNGDGTLNRQGVLIRNCDRAWILNNYFANGMRIKCGFGGNGIEVAGNFITGANDNAISFLDNSTTSTINYHIHHNFIIAPVGCGIVFGDDGGGSAGQTFYNITIDHNVFYGPLQDSQAFIQYRGSNISQNFKIDNNTCYNTGSGSNTFAINIGNQTGIGTDLDNSQVNNNIAYGVYDKAAFRFSNITNSTFTDNSAVAFNGLIVVGMLMSEVTDVLVTGGRFDACNFGMELSDDCLRLIVRDTVITDSVEDGVLMANVAAGTISVKFYGVTVTGSGQFGFNEASTGITASYYQWAASDNTSGNFQFNGTTSFRQAQAGTLSAQWTTGLAAGTTTYFANGSNTGDTTEIKRLTILPATTISYLAVTIGGNQPGSGDLVITLRQNQMDTALTVTVPAGSTGGFSVTDSTHSVRGEDDDLWDFKVVNNAAGASANDVSISAVMN